MIVDSIALTCPLPQAVAAEALDRMLAERQLQGALPLSRLLRLTDDLADHHGEVRWQALFACTEEGTRALQLQAEARLDLLCQRCLGALSHTVQIDRVFHLVETEEQADQLFEADPESEIEPLAAGKKFNLAELIEDELILSLPAIRVHVHCSEQSNLQMPKETEQKAEKKPSPFAGLAVLKKKAKS